MTIATMRTKIVEFYKNNKTECNIALAIAAIVLIVVAFKKRANIKAWATDKIAKIKAKLA